MKTQTKKAKDFVPVTVTKEQIIECHIAKGFGEEKAREMAESEHKRLLQYVSNRYQNELDYFIEHGVASDSTIGKEIATEQVMHLNRFFEALIAIARWDTENG